ncbi:SDR family NAD(P)-dependent oxidoreductase [Hoeflea prorocentri]|uniref:SDR family NAD(P)-dependent oxidoreductase n=1 Tax=Hoeflea prorocentri TaxID=1922333 RepID=A0A9X3ZFN7_9HYPH|nr:SDR family oxidoreductase [Hoeflea prorocentri]MCY6379408.1 SDR family NAD(P)-dependent oxidoreductase [Hoeflea prorocentri]MDA5397209.1 SDR family NAD(P)-dependent oxidoreductase [Hoeflea prorocentri]
MQDTNYKPGAMLTGKRALIVGAGSVGSGWGNGRAIVSVLRAEGAAVCGIDQNLSALQETERYVGAFEKIVCDVIDQHELENSVLAAQRHLGQIDILVNCVGGSVPGDILTLAPEAWLRQFELNVGYVFRILKLVLPVMIKRKSGSVINVGSIAGIRCLESNAVAYSAAKAALIQLGRSSAISVARQGVRINTVIPGLMNTPLVTERLMKNKDPSEAVKFIAERDSKVPIGKMGDAWDVAHAVSFLSSDRAKSITGTELVIDGGLTLRC